MTERHLEVKTDIGRQALLMTIYNYRPDVGSIDVALRHVDYVIFIDNSSDSSVSEYVDDLVAQRVDKCVLIRLGRNLGLSRAYNLAIDRAKGLGATMVFLVDHDAILSEDLFIHSNELWSLLTERGVKLGGIVPIVSDDRTLLNRGIGLRRRFFTVSSTITSGLFTSVDVMGAVGGFDEKLFVEGADFELTSRMRLQGWKLYCINKVLIVQDFEKPIVNDRFPTWFGCKLTRFRSIVRVGIGNCNIFRTNLSTYNETRWSELSSTLMKLKESQVGVMASVIYVLDRLEATYIRHYCMHAPRASGGDFCQEATSRDVQLSQAGEKDVAKRSL